MKSFCNLIRLNRFLLRGAILTFCFVHVSAAAAEPSSYLDYARIQVDTLLERGLDRYGDRNSDLWGSVIDINSNTVPTGGIQATEGVREFDRAMGGSNLYHELDTIKTMDLLSEILGDDRYKLAADKYIEESFELTQNPNTGLLGWGEHLYFNFYLDKVWVGPVEPESKRDFYYEDMPHEFLGRTPPWIRLNEVNPKRVTRAIDGLIYHFNGPDPKTYLFNRHAFWHKPERQTTIMPWIKHSALYAYSWAYQYQLTGDKKYLRWSYDSGSLYYKLRDEDTGLIFGVLVHHDVGEGKTASIGEASNYTYWLYKAYQLSGDNRLRAIALSAIDAYIKHADRGNGEYFASLNLDATPTEDNEIATAWSEGYSSFRLPKFGRTLIYLANHESLTDYGSRAEAVFDFTLQESIPERFNAEQISESMMFCLDLYAHSPEAKYLNRAKELAELAIDALWRGTMFSRQTSDAYYESKLGSSSLGLAFLRLHLELESERKLLGNVDWSY
jgi:hypothetical protein